MVMPLADTDNSMGLLLLEDVTLGGDGGSSLPNTGKEKQSFKSVSARNGCHGGRGKFLTRSSSGTAGTGRLATEPFCDGHLVCFSQVAHSER